MADAQWVPALAGQTYQAAQVSYCQVTQWTYASSNSNSPGAPVSYLSVMDPVPAFPAPEPQREIRRRPGPRAAVEPLTVSMEILRMLTLDLRRALEAALVSPAATDWLRGTTTYFLRGDFFDALSGWLDRELDALGRRGRTRTLAVGMGLAGAVPDGDWSFMVGSALRAEEDFGAQEVRLVFGDERRAQAAFEALQRYSCALLSPPPAQDRPPTEFDMLEAAALAELGSGAPPPPPRPPPGRFHVWLC